LLIGADASVATGGYNTWYPNNLSVTPGTGNDSLVDSPTNYGVDTRLGGEVSGNYATLNPLFGNIGGIITDGNLTLTHTGGANSKNALGVSSIAMSTGKWYCEFTNTAGVNSDQIGIVSSTNTSILTSGNPYLSGFADGYSAFVNGGTFKGNNNTNSAITNFGGSSPVLNEVYMVALDMDNNKVWFGRDGSWANSGNPASGTTETYSILSGRSYYFACNTYLGDQLVANFGQRPFAYTAPTGFKALCTANLPTPTIKKPSSYFDVVTRTSDGASNYTKTGLEFSPDFIWTKDRTSAYDNILWDSVRGATKYLISNTIAAEATAGQLASFNSNGYTINYGMGQANFSTDRYVDWIWDESPISGMDIVSYTGTGANMTISHSLGVTPKLIINKIRSGTGGWPVYHASLGNTGAVQLEATGAFNVASAYWVNTSPTSSNFTVGSGLALNGSTYINYLFAEVEGFSKFGSYTGNGSADGPFVYCGFRPKFIMYKRTDSTGNYYIQDTSRDTFNFSRLSLFPNLPNAEYNGGGNEIDILSNGFKMRTASTDQNASGGTYIYVAFAESPFKYSRAR
jgi:hypothetical protein